MLSKAARLITAMIKMYAKHGLKRQAVELKKEQS